MPTIEEVLNQGWKIHQSGNFRGAEDIYRQVLTMDAANANAWCFLGMACHDQTRYEDAVAAYRQALYVKPEFPVALSNLGNTFKALGRLDEAIASCQHALRLKPDYHTAYNNLGVALVSHGKLEEASRCFESAITYAPNDAVAHTNLSAALVRQGKYDEARQNSEQALRINPGYAEAHKNQGIVWLLLGDFEKGWDEYEWRWKSPGSTMPAFPQPLWDGSTLTGRTILLHAEQGLGDTLQFVRYATLLKRAGARVILQCQKALLPLLQGFKNADVLIDQTSTPPPFDVHAPLMSLPRICKTRLHNIPAEVPYLSPDSSLAATWRRELSNINNFFTIGIAWQGSPSNHGDKQRSTSLAQFAPLGRIPGVRFVSLQKGPGSEQIASERGRIDIVDFGERLDAQAAFVDTAALMINLDLVITVDTAIAHLAGALGVPVWIPLSYSPDWRWLLHRSDSPWYPTARLFRQPALGDYETVFANMAAALRELTKEYSPPAAPRETAATTSMPREPQSSRVASVSVRISPGELIDKITILEIKTERLSDLQKLANVRLELSQLRDVYSATIPSSETLDKIVSELKSANMALWQIEDEIRECERRQEFGARFIELARSVYHQNDRRSLVKRQLNDELGAQIIEEKSYAAY